MSYTKTGIVQNKAPKKVQIFVPWVGWYFGNDLPMPSNKIWWDSVPFGLLDPTKKFTMDGKKIGRR
jgi:hypothetical protein